MTSDTKSLGSYLIPRVRGKPDAYVDIYLGSAYSLKRARTDSGYWYELTVTPNILAQSLGERIIAHAFIKIAIDSTDLMKFRKWYQTHVPVFLNYSAKIKIQPPATKPYLLLAHYFPSYMARIYQKMTQLAS